jgi:hypothetical protein
MHEQGDKHIMKTTRAIQKIDFKKLLKSQQIFIEPHCEPQIPTQTLKIWTMLKLMHLHMTTSDKTKTDTPPI